MTGLNLRAALAKIPALAPLGEENEELLANVRPPGWVNPSPGGRYNLVVIGAGAAGLVTAAGAAGLGARVALIEKHLLGGDCLNVGCVPSKALIRCARAWADVRDAGDLGIEASGRVDFPAVMDRMRRLRASLSSHDSAKRFKALGIDVFIGEGRFKNDRTITVGDAELHFSKAVIATGARAAAPPIPGLDEVDFLTNETVFSLTALPARLAVIGGGPIGCELSQAFARFGSKVSLIELNPQILVREDPDAARLVQQALERDGVTVLTGSRELHVEKGESGKVLRFVREGVSQELVVDEILVGVGRAPNVEGLGLENAGVEFDPRIGVKVDDRLRTANRRIFAAGDICSAWKFTHTADAMARIVIQNALFKGRARASALTVPWVTYTDPEIAHVGLYENDCADKGIDVETHELNFSSVDRAVLDGEGGIIKVHVPKGSDKILGATIVARHAGDMISEITLAMVGGLGLKTIGRTIHPYPTQAEAIKKVADAWSRTRLTPFVMKLFEKWLAISR